MNNMLQVCQQKFGLHTNADGNLNELFRFANS